MRMFRIYSTSACHLCELAHEMLIAAPGFGTAFKLEEVDISESDALVELYGIRIPVLQHPDGGELGWPFSNTELYAFLTS